MFSRTEYIDFLNEHFSDVFYFIMYEVFGRITAILLVAMTVVLSLISGCTISKRGWEYTMEDSDQDRIICEDGTAYIRWLDHHAWFGNGEEENRCGWGTYTTVEEAPPYRWTYRVKNYFRVYTYDHSIPPAYLTVHESFAEFSTYYLRADITLPDPMTELPICLRAVDADAVAITDKETIAAMVGSRVADGTLKKPADGETRIFYCYYEENSALIRVLMLTRLDDGTYLAAWDGRYGTDGYWQIADEESVAVIDAVFQAMIEVGAQQNADSEDSGIYAW